MSNDDVIRQLSNNFLEDAIQARATLRAILDDEKVIASSRIAAAKVILDIVGVGDKIDTADEKINPYSELTVEELRSLANMSAEPPPKSVARASRSAAKAVPSKSPSKATSPKQNKKPAAASDSGLAHDDKK